MVHIAHCQIPFHALPLSSVFAPNFNLCKNDKRLPGQDMAGRRRILVRVAKDLFEAPRGLVHKPVFFRDRECLTLDIGKGAELALDISRR